MDSLRPMAKEALSRSSERLEWIQRAKEAGQTGDNKTRKEKEAMRFLNFRNYIFEFRD